jgi:hypothetical protein
MRRLLAVTALFATLTAVPALAEDPPPSDPTLLMNPAPLPVTRNGRLVNYIFVTLRLVCRQGTDMGKIRPKEPFFRDALVRSAARSSLAQPDAVHLDEARLKAAVMRDAPAIAGPGVVIDVRIIKQQPQKPFVAPDK